MFVFLSVCVVTLIMATVNRRKRASDWDLYRACRGGADCISDVVNKYEHKTPADKVLQYGGAGVFLGGLGIGTGSGALGVRPGVTGPAEEIPLVTLGERTTITDTGSGRTPSLGSTSFGGTSRFGSGFGGRIDLISAGRGRVTTSDVSVNTVDSVTPSVILPETVPADPGIELQVFTDVEDSVQVTVSSSVDEGEVAVLEVPATESFGRPSQVTTRGGGGKVHHSRHVVPAETGTILGETSETQNIFIEGSGVGDSYSESIELWTYSRPRYSTPDSEPPVNRRGINNPFSKRYYKQVTVEDPQFLTEPQKLVSNVFENPAFVDDVDDSIPFLDTDTRPYNTESDFLDIGRLGRVQYTVSPGEGLGVSRIGTRFTIKTRSGVTIGEQVHYRYPLSPITGASEDIELQNLVTGMSEGVLDSLNDTVVETLNNAMLESVDLDDISDFLSVSSSVLENELMDNVEDITFGQLAFRDEGETEVFTYPDYSNTQKAGVTVISEDNVTGTKSGDVVNETTINTHGNDSLIDVLVIDDYNFYLSYYLHPANFPKKKRRKLWYM
ncbi:L2 protein [Rusa timorensis papillomavirus type 2]|uniref:Minor capsid protein L2 n=1 Tax=Rusa timorensis papillomavirus type 2 TaxID=1905556 RepID=A0A2R2Z1A6_9PAPI|nr:L2 protein [Rusa timorensis papillomavirus type 2]AOS89498.1 L2 protein [Rusa timorensis papillomavirus type 2]